jgi:hypothetical protein
LQTENIKQVVALLLTKRKFNNMKKIAILSVIALSGLIYNTANAQIRVHVGFNLGQPVVYEQPVYEQPVYEQPEQVYDDESDDDYYYLPDVGAYYSVSNECYYYNDGDNWISAAYLPGSYRNYDWRSVRRYEIHEQRPFARDDFYRSRFNGRQVAAFRHFNRDNGFGGGYRNDDHHNHDAYYRNDNHFNNRGDDYNHHGQNRGGDNHYGSRQQGYDGRSNQNSGNRGQGGQQYQNWGNNGSDHGSSAQPSNQNSRGNERINRGSDDHFARNTQTVGMSHRMAR